MVTLKASQRAAVGSALCRRASSGTLGIGCTDMEISMLRLGKVITLKAARRAAADATLCRRARSGNLGADRFLRPADLAGRALFCLWRSSLSSLVCLTPASHRNALEHDVLVGQNRGNLHLNHKMDEDEKLPISMKFTCCFDLYCCWCACLSSFVCCMPAPTTGVLQHSRLCSEVVAACKMRTLRSLAALFICRNDSIYK